MLPQNEQTDRTYLIWMEIFLNVLLDSCEKTYVERKIIT